jgi:phage shock protein PspC (stress-responsive transcriptional regulator)
VGGVASGIADYLNLDPVLVRIGFVLATVLGGGGVVLYLVMWVIVPEEATGDVLFRRDAGWTDDVRRVQRDRGWIFWAGVALIAVAMLSLFDRLFFFDGSVLGVLVLLGIGVALFRNPSLAPGNPGNPGNESTDGAASGTTTDDAPGAPPAPPPPRGQQRMIREHSMLGRLTIGMAVLWVGLAALLDEANATVDFTLAGVLGVAMAILGVGLLAGAVVGRARWLILIALLLTPVLFAASFLDRVDVPFSAGVGQRSFGLTDANPSLDAELLVGELSIDAAQDNRDGLDRTIDVRMGAGKVEVRVPSHWTIVLHATIAAGEISIGDRRPSDGSSQAGVNAELDETFPGQPGAPTVTINAELAVGQFDLVRYQTLPTDTAAQEVPA